jgi:23S rRNA pseudouridine1911/1915/1917 synthase
VTDLAFDVPVQSSGVRLDRFLADQISNMSRAQIQRLIATGNVAIDGLPADSSDRLLPRQKVQVQIPMPTPVGIVATDIPIDIVRERPGFVIINKPAGLVVHPAPGHPADTLANALLARYPGLAVGNAVRPGIVHRLDKGTSGLMVVALTDAAYQDLVDQMKRRAIHKEYFALVHGRVGQERGTIEAPIGRDHRNRQKMGIVPEGREARTHFQVLERFAAYTLLRLRLETGRTHQIRVHLQAIGHSIVGDTTYGSRSTIGTLDRPFLHSCYLGFQVPGEDACVVAWAPMPDDLTQALSEARAETPP